MFHFPPPCVTAVSYEEGMKSLFVKFFPSYMPTIHFPERSEGLLSVSGEAIGLTSSKDQSPVRGARRENNDVRNGIPERKVPVIGNLSLPTLPSLFSLAVIHIANVRLQGRRSIVPWHPWENRIRELCSGERARERKRERGRDSHTAGKGSARSDTNLIREKDKYDEKKELVRFLFPRRHRGETRQRVYPRGFPSVLSFPYRISPRPVFSLRFIN